MQKGARWGAFFVIKIAGNPIVPGKCRKIQPGWQTQPQKSQFSAQDIRKITV